MTRTPDDDARLSLEAAVGGAAPDQTAEARLESEFLALISHELRSPLTAIKGYAATLRRRGERLGTGEREEFLRAIEAASDRLDLMIARLLTLSRLDTGLLKPRLEPVDMVYLVREALISAERRWGGAVGGHIFIAPEQERLPLALADLRLQRDVLDIVLENAVQYSPKGSVIWLTARVESATLVISVHDRGSGIAPEQARRIFDRFTGAGRGMTREHGGLGIGLAICKRIMALQGGNIWVESEPGVGSVFSLRLLLEDPTSE